MFELLEPRVLLSAVPPFVSMDNPTAEVRNLCAIDIDVNIEVNVLLNSPLSSSTSDRGNPEILLEENNLSINVALVDVTLDDSELIISSFDTDVFVIEYNGGQERLTDILNKVNTLSTSLETEIESLSIISHGSVGQFELGTDIVSVENLSSQADDWSSLAEHLAEDANIYLVGCNVAADTDEGAAILNGIADLTGGDVFASDDITGAGGDWQLEAVSAGGDDELAGGIDMPINAAIAGRYDGSLATAIAINNSGFEDPPLNNGEYNYIVTGWSEGYYTTAAPTTWVSDNSYSGAADPDNAYGYSGRKHNVYTNQDRPISRFYASYLTRPVGRDAVRSKCSGRQP